jgi:hypothetical protein
MPKRSLRPVWKSSVFLFETLKFILDPINAKIPPSYEQASDALQKAAGLSGVAGGFCRLSLHRSQIL